MLSPPVAIQWTCCNNVYGASVAHALSKNAAGDVYYGMRQFVDEMAKYCKDGEPLFRMKSEAVDDPGWILLVVFP